MAKTTASGQKKKTAKAAPKKPPAKAKAASGKTASGKAKTAAKAAVKTTSKKKTASKQAGTAKKAVTAKKSAAGNTASKAAGKAASKAATAQKKASAKAPSRKAPGKSTTAAASKSTAAKQKPAFDQKFLDRQTKLLLAEREKYFQSSVNLESEAQQLLETREQGDVQFDEESAQGDSWAIEREQDLILSAGARATVEKIDAALARIESGTYGICQKTGKAIPKARLQAIPWATERVEQRSTGLLLR